MLASCESATVCNWPARANRLTTIATRRSLVVWYRLVLPDPLMLTVKLDPKLKAEVRALAAALGVSTSELVR